MIFATGAHQSEKFETFGWSPNFSKFVQAPFVEII